MAAGVSVLAQPGPIPEGTPRCPPPDPSRIIWAATAGVLITLRAIEECCVCRIGWGEGAGEHDDDDAGVRSEASESGSGPIGEGITIWGMDSVGVWSWDPAALVASPPVVAGAIPQVFTGNW